MEGTPQQPQQQVSAGWYPDPNGQGQRYWDGAAWTEHTAPAAGAAAQPAAATGSAGYAAPETGDGPTTLEWVLSIVLPLLLPLAGLIWGIYLRTKGPEKETPANVSIVLSLVIILIAVLVLR